MKASKAPKTVAHENSFWAFQLLLRPFDQLRCKLFGKVTIIDKLNAKLLCNTWKWITLWAKVTVKINKFLWPKKLDCTWSSLSKIRSFFKTLNGMYNTWKPNLSSFVKRFRWIYKRFLITGQRKKSQVILKKKADYICLNKDVPFKFTSLKNFP